MDTCAHAYGYQHSCYQDQWLLWERPVFVLLSHCLSVLEKSVVCSAHCPWLVYVDIWAFTSARASLHTVTVQSDSPMTSPHFLVERLDQEVAEGDSRPIHEESRYSAALRRAAAWIMHLFPWPAALSLKSLLALQCNNRRIRAFALLICNVRNCGVPNSGLLLDL